MTDGEIEPRRPGEPVPTSGPLTPAQRRQVENELIKSMMLASASYAPPSGQIRFRVLDHGEVTKTVTIATQDALEINRRAALRQHIRDDLQRHPQDEE